MVSVQLSKCLRASVFSIFQCIDVYMVVACCCPILHILLCCIHLPRCYLWYIFWISVDYAVQCRIARCIIPLFDQLSYFDYGFLYLLV